MKRRLILILILTLITIIFSACSTDKTGSIANNDNSNDSTNTVTIDDNVKGDAANISNTNLETLNSEAKAAYEEVLNQYREATKLTWKEYKAQKQRFNYVSELAMGNCYGDMERYIYCAYYDLNNDGLLELLIGSDGDATAYDTETNDVFVYNNGNIYSVFENEWKNYVRTIDVYPISIFRDNSIHVSVYYKKEKSGKDSYYQLDPAGEKLILKDELSYKKDHHYFNEKEISEDEYIKLKMELYRDLDPDFESHDPEDVPYEVFTSTPPNSSVWDYISQ